MEQKTVSKYPPLQGICKIAIEKEWCLGCNKLESKEFVGVESCQNLNKDFKQIKLGEK